MGNAIADSLFAIVLVGANVGLHLYLWKRLVDRPRLEGPSRLVAKAILVLFALLVPLNFAISPLFVRDAFYPLPQVIWAWLAVAFYMLLVFVPQDILDQLRRWRGRPAVQGGRDSPVEGGVDRRLFMTRALAGSAAALATGVTGYGIVRANGDFELPEIAVKLDRLPPQLEGLRIVHVSDIHIGPVLDGRFIDHLVEQANALRPDLVCITGDLVDGSVRSLGDEVGRLTKLKSRYGVAFTTGNHEYYSGAWPWLEFIRGLGFHVLENQRIRVGDPGPGGASFDLAGIHDWQGPSFHPAFTPNLKRALLGRDPERELVLMAHQPKQIAMAEGMGVGLQLSGHTHGGQVWPFGLATHLVEPYLKGHHVHHDGTQIYVSCGAGYWGPPIRVGAPPEIASIILTS